MGFDLLGLDTLELVDLGHEKAASNVLRGWGLHDFGGPRLDLRDLRATKHSKLVYLPKDLLEKLYARFALANPKGTRIVTESQLDDYAPPGLTEEDEDRLHQEGKLFLQIPGYAGYPRLRELLTELDDPAVRERLASDPALDLDLISRATLEGALPREYGPRHWRWLPQWEAYVAAYKKTANGRE
jgi:hypothetical protein